MSRNTGTKTINVDGFVEMKIADETFVGKLKYRPIAHLRVELAAKIARAIV